MIPKAPEVMIPATANPMVTTAGTNIGLKMIRSGVATASPTSDPARVIPARESRIPPIGRSVTTASICDADGPSLGRILLPVPVPVGRCCC